MPRDPFQLSSVVTSQYSKTFFWKKFPENPLSHSPKVCLYGLSWSNKILYFSWVKSLIVSWLHKESSISTSTMVPAIHSISKKKKLLFFVSINQILKSVIGLMVKNHRLRHGQVTHIDSHLDWALTRVDRSLLGVTIHHIDSPRSVFISLVPANPRIPTVKLKIPGKAFFNPEFLLHST